MNGPSNLDWDDIHRRLSEQGGFRVKQYTQKTKGGGTGKTFSYIDARDVMDRLDEVVGPENWEDDYELVDAEHGIVKCRLTVYGTTKSGIGYPNNPGSDFETEPVKAAESDALKRAGIKWGIGRFLYRVGGSASDGNAKPPQQPAKPQNQPTPAIRPPTQPPVTNVASAQTQTDTPFRVSQKCEVCGQAVTTVSADAMEHLRMAKGLGWVVVGKKPSKWYCPDHADQAQPTTTPTMPSTGPKPAISATNAQVSGNSAAPDEERRLNWVRTVTKLAEEVHEEHGIQLSALREQWTEKLGTPMQWGGATESDLRRIYAWLIDQASTMKAAKRRQPMQGATA